MKDAIEIMQDLRAVRRGTGPAVSPDRANAVLDALEYLVSRELGRETGRYQEGM